MRRWGALAATAVVLDPHSGEVLALAVEPGFDANRFPQTSREVQRNRAVTDTYEPGSTLKVVTVAGALSEGLVSPTTQFTLAPKIQVADREIHEAHRTHTERMTVASILAQSSNIGTITLAQLLGRERLTNWLGKFGFGRKTGIDFPGETQGSSRATGRAPRSARCRSATASPSRPCRWRPPTPRSRTGRLEAAASRPVESREAAPRHLPRGLRAADVDDARRRARGHRHGGGCRGLSGGGKTGTAAKPDPRGGYSTSRYVASFVGAVPASDPRLVILVTVDEPSTIWGGTVAAPAFQQIARLRAPVPRDPARRRLLS